MNADVFRFNIGSFKCMALSEGSFTYPSASSLLFANAHAEDLREKLHEHHIRPEHWTEWISPYTCLAIDTGNPVCLSIPVLDPSAPIRFISCAPLVQQALHRVILIPLSSHTRIPITSE
jgi:hypothetical protein